VERSTAWARLEAAKCDYVANEASVRYTATLDSFTHYVGGPEGTKGIINNAGVYIQGVSGGTGNIVGGCIMDYSD